MQSPAGVSTRAEKLRALGEFAIEVPDNSADVPFASAPSARTCLRLVVETRAPDLDVSWRRRHTGT